MGNPVTLRLGALVVVFLSSCLWQACALADSSKVNIEEPQLHKLAGRTHDRESIAISIKVSSSSQPIPYSNYLGTGAGRPKTLVTDLKVQIAGQQLFVPLSTYSDLSATREASLEVEAGRTLLVLTGGDASEGYKVAIAIGNHLVSSREVYSLLAPSNPTQKTEYSLVEIKDE